MSDDQRPTVDFAPSSIELHIDELVLHGFAPGERYAIAAAVERELGRLLAERGIPAGWAQGLGSAQLDAGAFDVPLGTTGDTVGRQVAQAVYSGLSTAKS